jgi:hypothetical protein
VHGERFLRALRSPGEWPFLRWSSAAPSRGTGAPSELAGAVGSEFPEVPVLFVSGQSPTTDLDSVAPRNEFVKKPFDPRVFADTARKLVMEASQPNHGPVRRQLGTTARGTVWSRLCPDAPDG